MRSDEPKRTIESGRHKKTSAREKEEGIVFIMRQISTKLCPSCGALCFSDATRCYECLYEFGAEEAVSKGKDKSGSELVAVGVVVVEKESAPEDALEVTMRFDNAYASRLASSFSPCS